MDLFTKNKIVLVLVNKKKDLQNIIETHIQDSINIPEPLVFLYNHNKFPFCSEFKHLKHSLQSFTSNCFFQHGCFAQHQCQTSHI